MPLEFPSSWRFARATFGPVPGPAMREFETLVLKVTAQATKRWNALETCKSYFAESMGTTSGHSSSESWAESDLLQFMGEAASNPPLFLEALFDLFEAMRSECDVPDAGVLNEICRAHGVQYLIQFPKLVMVGSQQVAVPEPEAPSLADEAAAVLRESVHRAQELANQGRPREAVQEMLWILESVSTVFIGVSVPGGNLKGKYFNEIAKELKQLGTGTTLERAIEWCTQLHGYLSSPTGGGVRHGANLLRGRVITDDEGRFFVNLIMSYVSFLLAEHRRLVT